MDIREQKTDFILLKGDLSNDVNKIEESHLDAISKSNFLFVINPKDYIGISTAFEIGYSKALNIPINFSEKTKFDLKNNIKLDTIKFDNKDYFVSTDNKKNRQYLNYIIEDLEKKYPSYKIITKKTKINKLNCAEFLLIDNQKGKINTENALSIGYAFGLNIPIIFTYPPSDILLSEMSISIKRNSSLNNELKILIKSQNYMNRFLGLFYKEYRSLLKLI